MGCGVMGFDGEASSRLANRQYRALKKAVMPVQDDRFGSTTSPGSPLPVRLPAVESDHPVVRGAVIALVTERSCGGAAPGR